MRAPKRVCEYGKPEPPLDGRHPSALQDSTEENRALKDSDSTHDTTSQRAPEAVGAFPHAKRVGDLLFLSGIGPRKRGTKQIPGVTMDKQGNVVSYDITAQCHAVFENVGTVLEDAGAEWNDIVDVTVFLTNMDDFAAFNKLYAEYFAGP